MGLLLCRGRETRAKGGKTVLGVQAERPGSSFKARVERTGSAVRGHRVQAHGFWNIGGAHGLCVHSPPEGKPDELKVLYETDMQCLNTTMVS